MRKTTTALLTALTLGGAVLAAPPSASALPPTMGEAAIVENCRGRVVDSGTLTDSAGMEHPTAHWVLTRIGKDRTTYCFQVFSGTTERVGMAVSIGKDGGAAYERSTYVSATPGVTVHHAKDTAISFSGSIDDGATTYEVSRTDVRF